MVAVDGTSIDVRKDRSCLYSVVAEKEEETSLKPDAEVEDEDEAAVKEDVEVEDV